MFVGDIMQPVRFKLLDRVGAPVFETPVTSRDVADLLRSLGEGDETVETVEDQTIETRVSDLD